MGLAGAGSEIPSWRSPLVSPFPFSALPFIREAPFVMGASGPSTADIAVECAYESTALYREYQTRVYASRLSVTAAE